MTYPKNHFRKYVLALSLISSVALTTASRSSPTEEEVVSNLLERSGTSMTEFAEDALRVYQPFVDVSNAIQQEALKVVTPSISATYISRNVIVPDVILNHWIQAESTVTHPLLKAVCVFQHCKASRIQDSVMGLHEHLLDLLQVAAAELKDKKTQVQVAIMLARQAEDIDNIVKRIGFEHKRNPGFITQMSRLIALPAELWRNIADDESVYKLDADVLYRLVPKRVLSESWNPYRHIIEECGFESIDGKAIRANWPPEWFEPQHRDAELKKKAEHRKLLDAVFKAFCLYRASGFDHWSYRYRANTRINLANGEYAVESVIPDVKRMLKTYRSTAKAIDKIVEFMPQTISLPVFLRHGAEGSWHLYCKFRLTAFAAALRSIPADILDSKSIFNSRRYLKEDEITLLKEAKEDMEPILKLTHKKVIGFAEVDELGWTARLVLVRSIHDLAMFETDKATQLQQLKKALELSNLRSGEHDPTSPSLTDDFRGVHRYPYTDLSSMDGDFVTWEGALNCKIKQLEQPKEK